MRYKTVEVEPFKYTYRAYNKATGDEYGEFVRLIEAIRFIHGRFTKVEYFQPAISFTLKKEGVYRYVSSVSRLFDGGKYSRPRYEYEYVDPTPWVILCDAGVVEEKEVRAALAAVRPPYTNHGYDAREEGRKCKGVRLTRKKGSSAKIKENCAQVPSLYWGGYSSLVRGYHRHPATMQERRANVAHVDEYGWNLVRGRRRKLPHSWDDLNCSMWDTEDNWKHHSKRRKQWIPK